MSGPAGRIGAVVVDYDAPEALAGCVRSLLADGVEAVVVVENGAEAGSRAALDALADARVSLLCPGRNLGYGAGANRGIAALDPALAYVLVCNPDLVVHGGALGALGAALDEEPSWAVVGPRLERPDGSIYPSVRRFPSLTDAAGHALLAPVAPDNPFSRRYRPDLDPAAGRVGAGWVSGACFLARRSALEELGGFDESYFMFAEDMDLCWRAEEAGWGVGHEPAAVVTHAEGTTRQAHPYRMLVAHHRSALRFAARTHHGWRKAVVVPAAAVFGIRLALACALEARRP